MAAYKLAQAAKIDLQRIYAYGFERWGEAAADLYYNALFDRFEEIAERPFSYPAVEHIRKGYRRSVCGVDSIYYRLADDGIVEVMAILGRQDADHTL
jgi:toxin ParE1/3/4